MTDVAAAAADGGGPGVRGTDAGEENASSDSEFDEEVERRRGIASRAARAKVVRDAAAVQQRKLADARRRAAERMERERELDGIRRLLQQRDENREGQHGRRERQSAKCPWPDEDDGAAMPAAEARAWAEHEAAWAALEGNTMGGAGPGGGAGGLTGLGDVPWPPREAGIVAAMAAAAAHAVAAGDRRLRTAHRRASLRWHPDAFLRRHGATLDPGTRDETIARVQRVSQAINSEWDDLQAIARGI